MPNSFIQNINNIAAKLDIIVEANSTFDAGVIPVLQEIALLDLDQAVLDLKKGTFFGNRKIDIDLALNKAGIVEGMDTVDVLAIWEATATTVYYSGATATFVDGTVIPISFTNDDISPMNISNHGTLVAQLLKHTAFTTKLLNTGIFDDIGGETGVLVRAYDIVGSVSNLERLQLHAVSGAYKDQNPVYYWGKTTSAFQTLSMRAAEIIKLGNDIDSIILLANRITEMLALQAKIPEFITNVDSLYNNILVLISIHTQISKIVTVNDHLANVDTVATNIAKVDTVAAQNANINTLIANIVAIQNASANAASAAESATLATNKANAILGLTTQTSTGAAGSLATVSYNPVDGKMTFSIPQGTKGDRGDAFTVNSVGVTADRSLYDTQIKGFSFLAIDVGMVYFKLSATSADWSIGSPFGKGDKGDIGLIGVGIDHVSFFSTTDASGFAGHAGATDTYRITNTDATTYDFVVYNGLNGVLIDDAALSLIATWSNQKISDQLAQKANQATTYTKTESDTALGLKFDKLGGSLGGALNEARATVASHATTADIWGALGNQIDFTGTATVTAFPNAPQAGATRELICAGACLFTASASMLIDGVTSGNTVTCAVGDTIIVRAISTTQFKLTRLKADGTAQVETAQLPTQTGNTGKYLTTNGATPSWGVISTGQYLNLSQIFTSGSFVTPTTTTYRITIVGAGGQGAYSKGANYNCSGGGAGGYLVHEISIPSGTTLTVTNGAGNQTTTAPTTGINGASGGTTTVTGTGISLSVTGGSGGVFSATTTPANGGVGGVATGGNIINVTGGRGGNITGSFTSNCATGGGGVAVTSTAITNGGDITKTANSNGLATGGGGAFYAGGSITATPAASNITTGGAGTSSNGINASTDGATTAGGIGINFNSTIRGKGANSSQDPSVYIGEGCGSGGGGNTTANGYACTPTALGGTGALSYSSTSVYSSNPDASPLGGGSGGSANSSTGFYVSPAGGKSIVIIQW